MTPRESGDGFGTACAAACGRRRRRRRRGSACRPQPARPSGGDEQRHARSDRRARCWPCASPSRPSHSCPLAPSPIRPAPPLRQGARSGRRPRSVYSSPCAVFSMRISVCTALLWPTGSTMMPPSRSWSISSRGVSSAAAVTMIRSKGACSGSPSEPSPCTTVMLCSAEPLEQLLGPPRQPPVPLDGVDPPGQPGEDRRLVARAGADLEHLAAPGHLERLGHQPDHGRLADGLAAGDRQRRVLEGALLEDALEEVGARGLPPSPSAPRRWSRPRERSVKTNCICCSAGSMPRASPYPSACASGAMRSWAVRSAISGVTVM